MKNRLETMRLGAGVMPGIYALIIAGAVAMPAYGQDPSGDLLIYLGHGAVDAQPVVDIFEEHGHQRHAVRAAYGPACHNAAA